MTYDDGIINPGVNVTYLNGIYLFCNRCIPDN